MSTQDESTDDCSMLSQESNSFLKNSSFLNISENQISEDSTLSAKEVSDDIDNLHNGTSSGGLDSLIEEYLRELRLTRESEISLKKYEIIAECMEEMTKEPKWSQYAKVKDKIMAFRAFGNDTSELFDILRVSGGDDFEPCHNVEFSRALNLLVNKRCNEILQENSFENERNENQSFVSLISEFIERNKEYEKSFEGYKDRLNGATNRVTEIYKIMKEFCEKCGVIVDNVESKISANGDGIECIRNDDLETAVSALISALQKTLEAKKLELIELQRKEELYKKASENFEYVELVKDYALQLANLQSKLSLAKHLKEQKNKETL